MDDAVWEMICAGKVREGMTKEECRLSLGNPDDVDSGHDWNSTLDIWRYENGHSSVSGWEIGGFQKLIIEHKNRDTSRYEWYND